MRAILMRSAVSLAAATFANGAAATSAAAEIKDYQIARMLNFRTDCRLHALRRVAPAPGEVERFSGDCGNRTFYPDGIEISCPEADDEWACKILTQKKSFDSLDILRRPQ